MPRRVKKNSKRAPKPADPPSTDALFTLDDAPDDWVWNIVIATRFWKSFLIPLKFSSDPQNRSHIQWPSSDTAPRNQPVKSYQWLKALSGVALELIHRAAIRLVQGEDRMNRDVFHADFANVQFSDEFCAAMAILARLKKLQMKQNIVVQNNPASSLIQFFQPAP